MNTSRSDIRTALVGHGQPLSDLMAGLATRQNLLHLEIVALIDLGPADEDTALAHARQMGVPLIGTHVEDLARAGDLDLVICAAGNPAVPGALRRLLPEGASLLDCRVQPLFEGIIRLVEENRALRLDSHRLKETRLRLNTFVETAPLAIYIKDTSLRYKRMNRHALHVLGLKEDEVVGKRDHAIFPGGGARWLQKVEQETLQTRQTLHAGGVLPVQGADMHVQVTLFPIIENGKVEGLYGLIEDTTELYESELKLHQVDERLNETQKYLREVLENSRDIIFLTDPEGKILSFNSGAENALKFSRDDVVGTPADRLCTDSAGFAKLLKQALRDGHATRYEAEFRNKELHPVICDISLTLIDGPDGKPLEVVCLCRDITTRLRLKNDLIRSERLAAVGQMASGVAHEINNPLAVIDTIAGMVEETLEDEGRNLDASTRDLLANAMERLHAQVKRVTTITHSLLGFVRKSQTGMAALDLQELLEECLYVLGTEIRRSRTRIVRLYDPRIPEFRSDPMLLEQVFVNLIKNALDAMDAVPDRDPVLEITTSLDEAGVVVRIQDNGIGIPKEEQEKIFNLFHTTKPAGKGTGLGLSIVHDILYRLGGSVRVASEPGQWTRFVVELPLTPPETLRPDPSISAI
ncbi:PAS domain S-box protein [bacterium]|nr:PAS domain S-box protein [bacterium]